jgi:two-component system phosphate regulon response regulator PhoB
MAETILIVDDEADVCELLAYQCQKAGFRAATAADGRAALEKARQMLPSLLVLDLMLPGMEGGEVCRTLKADPRTRHIPILMLTARAEEVDRVLGLELGADDYVTKPFSPREVILRIKSILRRIKGEEKPAEVLQQGDLRLDLARHEVAVKGKPVDLTATEFKLLATLMERRGRVQTREVLLSDVWGYAPDMDTRTVDTHMRRLRDKLGRCASMVETVRGVGYRLSAS